MVTSMPVPACAGMVEAAATRTAAISNEDLNLAIVLPRNGKLFNGQ